MESRLDDILELAREPQPTDELFVGRVMGSLRADAARRARRRRLLTQPVSVAAAAAIVLGFAVAGLVRSTGQSSDVALRTNQGRETVSEPEPNAPPRTAAVPSSKHGVRTDSDPSTVYRNGDQEWGYTSDTTAYAMDHETGLRLETEVYRTQFDTDVPHRVTLTLENTGDRPVAVTAPRGCALVVAAYPAERSGEETEDAYPWQCAASGETPGTSQDAERFVLGSGERLVAEATLVLPTSGEWSVVGMCQCSYDPAERAEPSDPAPVDNPLRDIGELGVQLPSIPTPSGPSEQGRGLVTPPLRVTAS